MTDPLGASSGDRRSDIVRAAGLAGVVDQAQPGVVRRPVHRAERLDRRGLVAGGSDAEDPVVAEAFGKSERAPRPVHRPPPGVVEDHPALDTEPCPTFGQTVQHALQGHLRVPEPFTMSYRGE